MKRGDIWWVDFEPTRGSEIRKRRPAVILTDNALNRVRRTVVVVPLSSSPQPQPPLVIPVASAGQDSVAVCDQLRAVDKTRLNARMGTVTEAELRLIEKSMRSVLNL